VRREQCVEEAKGEGGREGGREGEEQLGNGEVGDFAGRNGARVPRVPCGQGSLTSPTTPGSLPGSARGEGGAGERQRAEGRGRVF